MHAAARDVRPDPNNYYIEDIGRYTDHTTKFANAGDHVGTTKKAHVKMIPKGTILYTYLKIDKCRNTLGGTFDCTIITDDQKKNYYFANYLSAFLCDSVTYNHTNNKFSLCLSKNNSYYKYFYSVPCISKGVQGLGNSYNICIPCIASRDLFIAVAKTSDSNNHPDPSLHDDEITHNNKGTYNMPNVYSYNDPNRFVKCADIGNSCRNGTDSGVCLSQTYMDERKIDGITSIDQLDILYKDNDPNYVRYSMYTNIRDWISQANALTDPILRKKHEILFNMIVPCLEADRPEADDPDRTYIQWPEYTMPPLGFQQRNIQPSPTDPNVGRLLLGHTRDNNKMTYEFNSLNNLITFINNYLLPYNVVLPLGILGSDFNYVSNDLDNLRNDVIRVNTNSALEMNTQVYNFLEQFNINYNSAKNIYVIDDIRYLNLNNANLDIHFINYNTGNIVLKTALENAKNSVSNNILRNIHGLYYISLFSKLLNPLEDLDYVKKQSDKIINTFITQHYTTFLNLNNQFSIPNPDNNFHRVHLILNIDIPYPNSKINIYYSDCVGNFGSFVQSAFYQPFCNENTTPNFKYESFVEKLKNIFNNLTLGLIYFRPSIMNILSKSHSEMTKSIYPIGIITNPNTVPMFPPTGILNNPMNYPIVGGGLKPHQPTLPVPLPLIDNNIPLFRNSKIQNSSENNNISKQIKQIKQIKQSKTQKLKTKQSKSKTQKNTSAKAHPIMEPLTEESFAIVKSMLVEDNPIATFINSISVKPDAKYAIPQMSFKLTPLPKPKQNSK